MRTSQLGWARRGEISNPSALVGVFSTVNSWNSAAGQGFDLVPGTAMWITFEKPTASWPVREDLLSSQATSSDGWFINLGSGTGAFFWRGVGGGSATFSPDIYVGTHTLCITRTVGEAFRYSFDGAPAAQLSASPTYTSSGGSSVLCLGYNLTETNGACTATEGVSFGFINAALSDAELVSIAGNVNTKYRWDVPPAAAAHPSLVSAQPATSWDGVSASWVASSGSSPRTLTRRGTGGGKTLLPAMRKWLLPQGNWNDSSFYSSNETLPVPHTATGTFAWQELAHSAARSWLEVLCSLGTPLAENWTAGMDVDGAQVQTRRNRPGNGMAVFPGNIMTVRDVPTQTVAAHTYKITAGIQSKAGVDPLTGVFPQAIWIPVGTTPTWAVQAAPTNRIFVLGNSLPEQVSGTAANITTPCVQAWPMLARANSAAGGWRITTRLWGSGTWAQHITTSGGRQTLANEIAAGLDGTTKNIVYLELSTNDWGLNGYTVEATFITDLNDFIIRLIAATAGKPGIKILLQTPIHRANDTTLNASGTGMALIAASNSFSNAMAVVQAANPTVVLVNGAPLVTYSGGYAPDLLHLIPGNSGSPPGHWEYEVNFRALPDLGY